MYRSRIANILSAELTIYFLEMGDGYTLWRRVRLLKAEGNTNTDTDTDGEKDIDCGELLLLIYYVLST